MHPLLTRRALINQGRLDSRSLAAGDSPPASVRPSSRAGSAGLQRTRSSSRVADKHAERAGSQLGILYECAADFRTEDFNSALASLGGISHAGGSNALPHGGAFDGCSSATLRPWPSNAAAESARMTARRGSAALSRAESAQTPLKDGRLAFSPVDDYPSAYVMKPTGSPSLQQQAGVTLPPPGAPPRVPPTIPRVASMGSASALRRLPSAPSPATLPPTPFVGGGGGGKRSPPRVACGESGTEQVDGAGVRARAGPRPRPGPPPPSAASPFAAHASHSHAAHTAPPSPGGLEGGLAQGPGGAGVSAPCQNGRHSAASKTSMESTGCRVTGSTTSGLAACNGSTTPPTATVSVCEGQEGPAHNPASPAGRQQAPQRSLSPSLLSAFLSNHLSHLVGGAGGVIIGGGPLLPDLEAMLQQEEEAGGVGTGASLRSSAQSGAQQQGSTGGGQHGRSAVVRASTAPGPSHVRTANSNSIVTWPTSHGLPSSSLFSETVLAQSTTGVLSDTDEAASHLALDMTARVQVRACVCECGLNPS